MISRSSSRSFFLYKLEQELKDREIRESLLQSCQDELDLRVAEMGKAVDTPSPRNPNLAPSTFIGSIKIQIPVTLDMQDSN
jgi:hypothetical protein